MRRKSDTALDINNSPSLFSVFDSVNTAGNKHDMVASMSMGELICDVILLNFCSLNRKPPK